jgi:hypothetical protein
LQKFIEPVPIEYTLTENIKANKIGEIIERSHPFKIPGASRTYHGVSKDWIANEIFRRVEPSGRTFGEFFEQEIQDQLELDVYVRSNEEVRKRSFPLNFRSIWW